MKVVYASRALRDVDEILSYIQRRSPRGAHSVSLAIEYAIDMCALNPRLGARTNEPNVYRRPLGTYRYTIFYRLRENSIEIVRVIHGARVRDLGQLPDDIRSVALGRGRPRQGWSGRGVRMCRCNAILTLSLGLPLRRLPGRRRDFRRRGTGRDRQNRKQSERRDHLACDGKE